MVWQLLMFLCAASMAQAVDWLRLKVCCIIALLKSKDDQGQIQRVDSSKARILWSEADGVLKANQEVDTVL